MIRYFCDKCEKESITHPRIFYKEWISERLELCESCYKIYDKKRSKITKEVKKLEEEYRKKVKEIENRIIGNIKEKGGK